MQRMGFPYQKYSINSLFQVLQQAGVSSLKKRLLLIFLQTFK